ncbi:MAG: carboxypeptidase regulatory-like domain-containing protein [Phycisphaerae bacterium]
MKRMGAAWLALLCTAIAFSPTAVAQLDVDSLDTNRNATIDGFPDAAADQSAGDGITLGDPSVPPQPNCDVRTVRRGSVSHYGYSADDFLGEDLIIRTPAAWEAFWQAHTAGVEPRPARPPINFAEWVVLVAIQGPQSTGGGPNITIAGLETDGATTHIIVIDDERPGALDVITNPYHIVVVPRLCLPCERSIGFRHVAPRDDTGIVIGRVTTTAANSDEPIAVAGARISLLTPNAEQPFRVATSGFDGTYVFVNVPGPATFGIRCESQGFVTQQSTVEVIVGATTERNFHLVRTPPPPGSIRGLTLRPGNAPGTPPIVLPAVQVQLRRAGADEIIRQTTSGPEGGYEFGQIPAGMYVLRATKDGFQPADATVEVRSGQLTMRNLLLHPLPPPGGGVRGRTYALSSNPNTPNAPLPGVRVQVFVAGTNQQVADVTSGAEAVYEVANLPTGGYLLRATRDGYQPTEALVQVASGHVVTRDLVLRPNTPPPTTGGIRGQTQTNGATHDQPLVPLPDVRVQVFIAGTNTQVRDVLSGPLANYEVGQLAPGAYRLRASKDGYQPTEAVVEVVAGQQTVRNLLLHANQPPPTPRGNLIGVVLGIESNTHPPFPVEGALVRIRRPNSNVIVAERTTNAEGRFAFEQIETGGYVMLVSADGFANREAQALVTAGQTTNTTVVLLPAP